MSIEITSRNAYGSYEGVWEETAELSAS